MELNDDYMHEMIMREIEKERLEDMYEELLEEDWERDPNHQGISIQDHPRTLGEQVRVKNKKKIAKKRINKNLNDDKENGEEEFEEEIDEDDEDGVEEIEDEEWVTEDEEDDEDGDEANGKNKVKVRSPYSNANKP
jgi:hypothetical protein